MIDSANSTTTALGSSATYTGKFTEVQGFNSISIIGSSDVAGTLYGEFSTDGTTVTSSLQLSTGTSTDFGTHCLAPVAKYFRVKVVNGSSAQSSIDIQTIYSTDTRITIPTTRNNQTITDYSDVINTRSILVGKTSGGVYNNVSTEAVTNHLEVALPRTAFGELSTVEITPVIQVNFIYNINTDIVDTTVTGTGTVTQSNAAAVVSSGTTAGSTAKLSTKRVIKYRPGQGCVIRGTAIFTTGEAGTEQLFGVGDAVDGLFYGYNGADFGVLHRVNSVDTWVLQASWNGDKLLGSGDTGMTLDPTKGNVYEIQYQWLGFGMIKFSIEDSETGKFIPVHYIKYANANTTPSLYNPSFPIIWSVDNTGTTTDLIVKGSSCAGNIEGKVVYLGPRHSIGNTKTAITSTLTNIVTIRVRSTFNSITNKIPINILRYTGAVDGTKVVQYQIIKNTTLGGTPSYTDISTNTSVVEYDTAGTTITGGIVLDFGSVGKTDSFSESLNFEDIVLQPGDTLTIAMNTLSATSDASCSFVWLEDH
jgi:hypothetical protein